MTSAALRALVVSAALACGACAATQSATPSTEAATVAASTTPSPRPECAPARVTIYFAEEVASDQPVVMPLLNDLMHAVHACETAGGELRGITIAATTDAGLSSHDAADQLHRRQERVRNALVGLGVPANKIHNARAEGDAIMGRRAEVSADLY